MVLVEQLVIQRPGSGSPATMRTGAPGPGCGDIGAMNACFAWRSNWAEMNALQGFVFMPSEAGYA